MQASQGFDFLSVAQFGLPYGVGQDLRGSVVGLPGPQGRVSRPCRRGGADSRRRSCLPASGANSTKEQGWAAPMCSAAVGASSGHAFIRRWDTRWYCRTSTLKSTFVLLLSYLDFIRIKATRLRIAVNSEGSKEGALGAKIQEAKQRYR